MAAIIRYWVFMAREVLIKVIIVTTRRIMLPVILI